MPDFDSFLARCAAGLAESVAGVFSGVRSEVRPVRGSCHASLRALECHTSSSRISKGKSPKRRGFSGFRALEKVLPIRMPCRLSPMETQQRGRGLVGISFFLLFLYSFILVFFYSFFILFFFLFLAFCCLGKRR